MNKYKITWSPEFNSELDNILHYLNFKLKEPMVAKNFHLKLQKYLATMEYFPKKFSKLCISDITYRKCVVDKYIIIYQVYENTRTSLYFTYISWYSKLFKSIIAYFIIFFRNNIFQIKV